MTDTIFTFITTNNSFTKKYTNDLVKEIKSGAKENNIKAWFEIIYTACREYGKLTNETFGLYIGERNKLAKRLMSHYGF